ncbi:MAG: (d)CMP kinase [Rhodothermales bacterium]
MIIAIDGPAGSGKSTTARVVARRLGYLYLDTGAMYRAVALAFIRSHEERTEAGAERLLPSIKIDLSHDDSGLRISLNGEDVSEQIRQPDVTADSSKVAALPAVRRKLVEEQRRIARRYEHTGGGVVLDGRDIGTVVFPEADLKFFMTAEESVRARRRCEELHEKGSRVDYEDVLRDIRRRDEQDARRALAPLRQADDAVVLDTSTLSIEDQVSVVIAAVKERQNFSAV